MKLQYLLLVSITILFFNCKTDKLEPFVSENHLESFQTEKPQFFDLDTLEYKTIIGKHGTKIMYYRELFDTIYKGPIQLELIELYDFKEILYRNIPTITTKDELLETSGVLKIKFTSNGKELEIRRGKKLIVYPPKGRLKDNDIFLSKEDSLGNITWDITNQNFTFFDLHLGGGIYKQIIIPRDSLLSYEKRQKEAFKEAKLDAEYHNTKNKGFFILTSNNSKWINIDKLALIKDKINLRFNCENDNISGFNIYLIYEELEAFLVYNKPYSELDFKNLPVFGKTHLIFVGGDDNKRELYTCKVELNKLLHNKSLELKLKKTTKKQLKSLFE